MSKDTVRAKKISACYEIPENNLETASAKEWAIARKAIDIAIYQAGIREVVAWIKEHQMPDKPSSEPYPGLVLISKVQIEAKLKEWGYEE